MAEPLTDPEEHLLAEARRRLEPEGWSVKPRQAPGGFSFDITHPLTSSYGLGFKRGSTLEENMVVLDLALSQREFGVIAARPSEVPHAALVGKLRVSAHIHGWWPPDVLPVFAAILRDFDLLTPEESEWLYRAGPAWSQETDSSG